VKSISAPWTAAEMAEVDANAERHAKRDATRPKPVPKPVNGAKPTASPVPVATAERVTWRTLADVSNEPPRPLIFGMLEDGPNLLCGAPGVGKGTTGSWLIVEALAAGLRPMIYDAEGRPREWARRVSGLGGDRSRVVYVEPADLGPGLAGRPLWDLIDALRAVQRASGSDIVFIDSIMPAVGLGEERLRSDVQVPYLYVAALDSLAIPSVSFGHPPKGQPEGEPYGSYGWVAASRLTWLGTRAESERGRHDDHRVRWRPRKRNERGHIPGVLLTFTYSETGVLVGVERADDEESTRDWLLAALVHFPRAVADMAEEMHDAMENPAPGEAERIKERLGRALRRMAHEGWVRKVEKSGRAGLWALAERP
jgi:hypothetical protein